MYKYTAKVLFEAEELKKNGEPKTFVKAYILEDDAMEGVIPQLHKELKDSILSWRIIGIQETKIEKIIS